MARDECWWCGGKLRWQGDYDYSDVYDDGDGIITYLACTGCGAEVEYSKRKDDYEAAS